MRFDLIDIAIGIIFLFVILSMINSFLIFIFSINNVPPCEIMEGIACIGCQYACYYTNIFIIPYGFIGFLAGLSIIYLCIIDGEKNEHISKRKKT